MIDLHVHTTASDGTFSPEAVVRLAVARGLKAIAVTDHDTVQGIPAAIEAGEDKGLEIVAGVEISTHSDKGILHILGYFIQTSHPGLLARLDWLVQGRRSRIPTILSKLAQVDVIITQEEVDRQAMGGAPGRPHVARVMMTNGYVRTVQQAFDRYLGKGAPAYVDKMKLQPDVAIKSIIEASGVPVLAHPYSLGADDPAELERIVRGLMDRGLAGVEAYYSRHTRDQTKTYLELAKRLKLVVTGGSDFHGDSKPGVQLGLVPDVGTLPYSLLEQLKQRHAAVR